MIGFFEESAGVRSMSRLTIFSLGLQTLGVVTTTCVYVLRGQPDYRVVTALGAVLTALVANGIVALVKRGSGDDEAPLSTPGGAEEPVAG